MADDDPYESVSGGGLRLKGGKVKKNKKKKKKNKAEKILDNASSSKDEKDHVSDEDGEVEPHQPAIRKTPAELAFEKAQEKRAAERILQKASKTHKQRVEELNEYLGGLSEHYDIQKVSWTK